MGAIVKEQITSDNKMIINYPNNRTDYLDVYLSAHCKFFVGYSGGLYCIPRVFRLPIAVINMVPLHSYIYDQNYFLEHPTNIKHILLPRFRI